MPKAQRQSSRWGFRCTGSNSGISKGKYLVLSMEDMIRLGSRDALIDFNELRLRSILVNGQR
jgi:hypothetical protein